jgi:Zn-dependent M16 (insulinase) family peptidase
MFISFFVQLDKPKSPGSQGMTQFLHGIKDEMRQKNRDRIFACEKQDLIDVTKKYLVNKPSAATILGPDNPKFAVDGKFRQIKNVQMPSIGEQN